MDPAANMPMQGVVETTVNPTFSPDDEFYGAALFAERALGLTRVLSSEHLRGRFQIYRGYLDLQTGDLARFPDEWCDEIGLCSRITELRLVMFFDMLRSPLVDPRKECCLICSGMHGFKIQHPTKDCPRWAGSALIGFGKLLTAANRVRSPVSVPMRHLSPQFRLAALILMIADEYVEDMDHEVRDLANCAIGLVAGLLAGGGQWMVRLCAEADLETMAASAIFSASFADVLDKPQVLPYKDGITFKSMFWLIDHFICALTTWLLLILSCYLATQRRSETLSGDSRTHRRGRTISDAGPEPKSFCFVGLIPSPVSCWGVGSHVNPHQSSVSSLVPRMSGENLFVYNEKCIGKLYYDNRSSIADRVMLTVKLTPASRVVPKHSNMRVGLDKRASVVRMDQLSRTVDAQWDDGADENIMPLRSLTDGVGLLDYFHLKLPRR